MYDTTLCVQVIIPKISVYAVCNVVYYFLLFMFVLQPILLRGMQSVTPNRVFSGSCRFR